MSLTPRPRAPPTCHGQIKRDTHRGAFWARWPLQEHALEETGTVSEASAQDPRVGVGPLQTLLVRTDPRREDRRRGVASSQRPPSWQGS